MKKLIVSVDRITEDVAYLNLDNGEQELQLPLWAMPSGTEEGRAYTITIERNPDEEQRLHEEIEALREAIREEQEEQHD